MAATALLILLLAAPAVLAVQHTVGGSNGWSQSTDYSTWASGETFTVGDTLLFGYGGLHSVDVVSKDDYNKCNSGNALKSYTDGQTTVTLSKPGSMYFICGTSGHCTGGMKLAINVVAAASTTPSTGTTPAATPSPPSTTSPSGDKSPSIITPPSDSSSSGDTPPASTADSPTKKNGAGGHSGNLNGVMLGFSLGMAALVSFMV